VGTAMREIKWMEITFPSTLFLSWQFPPILLSRGNFHPFYFSHGSSHQFYCLTVISIHFISLMAVHERNEMDGNYHETIELVGTAMREINWMEITTRQ
jgi:hypothetical protein